MIHSFHVIYNKKKKIKFFLCQPQVTTNKTFSSYIYKILRRIRGVMETRFLDLGQATDYRNRIKKKTKTKKNLLRFFFILHHSLKN